MSDPVQVKKVIPFAAVPGYMLLRAGQRAIGIDEMARFESLQRDRRYKVLKLLPECGLKFILESSDGNHIDPRETHVYGDFMVTGYILSQVKGAEGLERETEAFAADVLYQLVTHADLPPDSKKICGYCPGDVELVWIEAEGQWECQNHGILVDDEIDTSIGSPFL